MVVKLQFTCKVRMLEVVYTCLCLIWMLSLYGYFQLYLQCHTCIPNRAFVTGLQASLIIIIMSNIDAHYTLNV